jgi:hypothetical protein
VAVSGTHLTTGSTGVDGTSSPASASITIHANRLVLVAIANQAGVATPATPTVSGLSQTWSQVLTYTVNSNRRLTVFRCMPSSDATGTFSASTGAESEIGWEWSASEFDGVDTSGTNGSGAIAQSATGLSSTASLTVSLTSPSASNAVYGAFHHPAAEAVAAGSGFTLLGTSNHASPNGSIGTDWRADGVASVTASWTTSAANNLGIGVEIVAGVTGGPAGRRQDAIVVLQAPMRAAVI